MNLIHMADAVPTEPSLFNFQSIFNGGLGTVVVIAAYYVFRIVVDRAIPTKTDNRASVQMLIEGLNNMVKVLQEEKNSDAARLDAKQKRIDELEGAADKDYDRIKELRDEIMELNARLSQKDRHINILVSELRKVGTQVTGLDLEDIEVTSTHSEVQNIRAQAGLDNEGSATAASTSKEG